MGDPRRARMKWWSTGRSGGARTDAPPRDTLHADFVRLVDAALARRGWSRADLARSMGCSPSHITNVLRHPEKLSLNVMLNLAEGAGVRLRLYDAEVSGG